MQKWGQKFDPGCFSPQDGKLNEERRVCHVFQNPIMMEKLVQTRQDNDLRWSHNSPANCLDIYRDL
jgi:hypothetical protein